MFDSLSSYLSAEEISFSRNGTMKLLIMDQQVCRKSVHEDNRCTYFAAAVNIHQLNLFAWK
jgi:hypothetical protein